MMSETFELLGKGMYNGTIPDVLTLKSIPTTSELDYVGSEDFDRVMIEKILPQAVEEKVDFYNLLEIDYQWICRCSRLINYGPYHTVNTIFCGKCHTTSHGEYIVNLYTIPCIPLPENFKNSITISKDEFIDYDKDVVIISIALISSSFLNEMIGKVEDYEESEELGEVIAKPRKELKELNNLFTNLIF